jgi:hypothetical protein
MITIRPEWSEVDAEDVVIEEFTDYYYKAFEQNRQGLAALYVGPDSPFALQKDLCFGRETTPCLRSRGVRFKGSQALSRSFPFVLWNRMPQPRDADAR